MDNKEAIEILRKIALCVPTGVIEPRDFYLALDLAIKALEEKPFEINVFLENADESTLFEIKKELARILTDRAEREAYAEARREAMKLDDNEDTLKWKGTH